MPGPNAIARTVASAPATRAYAFGLIADALAEMPNARLLAALRAPESAELFAACGIPFSIDALPGADAAKLYTWICEYDALFTGRGDHVLPYETVYRRGGMLGMWGARAEQVEAFAARWQLEPRPAGHRLDHISVELNVVRDLAAREAALVQRGAHADADRLREASAAFTRSHLAPWIPALAADVAARARIFVYRDMLQLAVVLVRATTDDRPVETHAPTERPTP